MIQEKKPTSQATTSSTTNMFPMKLQGNGPTTRTNAPVPKVPKKACSTCS